MKEYVLCLAHLYCYFSSVSVSLSWCSYVVGPRCESMSEAEYTEEDITFALAPQFDNLIPWHTPQHRKIAPSPTGKSEMFTLSTMITIHLISERDLLWASTWSFWKNWENRNEKRDENVWLEEIIQTWLNPAGLSTLLSTNRSPREIHSNALHRRDVWLGYWETSWN